MAASLRVNDSIGQRFFQNFSDSNGIVNFSLLWLKSDSAFLSLRVATDTLTTFTVYKSKTYGYEIVYYVDTEAIKKRNEAMRGRKKRKN